MGQGLLSILIFFLIITLAACGGSTNNTVGNNTNSANLDASFEDGQGAGETSYTAWGSSVGVYRGVTAYSNGNTHDIVGGVENYKTYGWEYQCVEYVNRFLTEAKGYKILRGTGNAKAYWDIDTGLTKITNNTSCPQTDDVLVSIYGKYGHLAIVREVTNNSILVIQQNWANNPSDGSYPIAYDRNGSNCNVKSIGGGSYAVAGWLRVPGSAQTDTSAPTNPTIAINNGSASTTSTSVTLNLSASDNIGVTGYCAKETSVSPSSNDSCWASVAASTSYSANVNYTLSSGNTGNNTKIVYVWFRDTAGNMSQSASSSINLAVSDTATPANPTITINNGATTTSSTILTLNLSASDNVGVTAYCPKEDPASPLSNDGCWVSVPSSVNYSSNRQYVVTNAYATGSNMKIYVWFRDAAGNTSTSANSSILYSTLTTLVNGLNNPYNIAIDNTSVYWVENSNSSGAVKKVPIGGGSVTTLTSGLAEPDAIAVDSSYVYWIERNNGSNGSIKKVPINGGSVTVLATGLNNAQNNIALDSNYIYYGDGVTGGGGAIRKVSKNGGGVITLISGGSLSSIHPAIAVDGTHVYFTDDNGNIKSILTGGGSVTTLGIGSGIPLGIVLNGSYLYWTEYNGAVKKVPITGGAVTTLANLPVGAYNPGNLAVDGSYVYVMESGNPGPIYKIPVNGGTATLVSDNGNTWGIAVDNTNIYWSEYLFSNAGKIQQMIK